MVWLEVTMKHTAFRASGGRAYTPNLTWRTILAGAALGTLFFVASCANKQASGQHATILMRDGTTLTGTVTATSSSEIMLAGDDNATHTIPTTQVKTIEYDDTSAAAASPTQPLATPTRHTSSARTSSDALPISFERRTLSWHLRSCAGLAIDFGRRSAVHNQYERGARKR